VGRGKRLKTVYATAQSCFRLQKECPDPLSGLYVLPDRRGGVVQSLHLAEPALHSPLLAFANVLTWLHQTFDNAHLIEQEQT
jgi:hypothetical protein